MSSRARWGVGSLGETMPRVNRSAAGATAVELAVLKREHPAGRVYNLTLVAFSFALAALPPT